MIAPPVDFWPCPSPWQKTFPVHPSGKLSPCQGRDGSFPRRRDGRHLQGQKSGACSDAAPHSLSEKRRWADFFSTSFNTIEALRRGNWWDIRWENRPPNCQKMLTNLFISSNWHSIRQFERAWVEKTRWVYTTKCGFQESIWWFTIVNNFQRWAKSHLCF